MDQYKISPPNFSLNLRDTSTNPERLTPEGIPEMTDPTSLGHYGNRSPEGRDQIVITVYYQKTRGRIYRTSIDNRETIDSLEFQVIHLKVNQGDRTDTVKKKGDPNYRGYSLSETKGYRPLIRRSRKQHTSSLLCLTSSHRPRSKVFVKIGEEKPKQTKVEQG